MPLVPPPKTRVTNSRKSSKTLLLTGFEPFGDDPGALSLNPSLSIAQALNGQKIGVWRVAGEVLPCEFGRSVRVLKTLMREYEPEAILCLGQAGGRSAISIERIAVNWDEAALADNAGVLRTGQAILKTAPAAYFSTLPIHDMRDALLEAGLPAELSSTAGHFVCNHVFFSLMHMLRGQATPAGFVHVPYLPEQAKLTGAAQTPSMSLGSMNAAIRCVIEKLAPSKKP
ncbi:pyroglutamyl-peptidase I [Variovorax sp. PCZ-1]|uniref:pyroglutamyl-peptidase I n=1 Tax=Variovorax sp. PCZ-1 TaxID=2835533 RepID=UPI001BCDC303|nr:pyroglutamyl-peptidase I [Variovorax sp. PCZ-1]MBS7807016.1 pyroglutamyl-peptidase I [Variovorax sp. PCZ-1]